MLKRSLILVVFFSNIFSDSSRILRHSLDTNLSPVEKILITMLKQCNLPLKNIIFYTGNNKDLTSAVLKIPPPRGQRSLILLSTEKFQNMGNLTAIDGFVVVYNSRNEYRNVMTLMLYHWQCSKECTVINVSKRQNSCGPAKDTLAELGYHHFDVVYFVCVHKQVGPVVITQNRYGDVRPFGWQKAPWTLDTFLYPWSVYFRTYNADLCRFFYFNRTIPTNNTRILVYYIAPAKNESELKPGYISDGNLENDEGELLAPEFDSYERLLKIEFLYYVKTFLVDGEDSFHTERIKAWQTSSMDITFRKAVVHDAKYTTFLFPTSYSNYVILSHIPRLATPLEKIAHFYGIWTLLSLITISIVTFIVIYLKTNRNATSAVFDVLRLLINSGVETPINTLSLKIFFCMVFLYFTVIHATFSGNLPKFLTIPESYGYIDTLEDLAKPEITTIYNNYFEYDNVKEMEIIKKKTKNLWNLNEIFNNFMEEQNSVCIMSRDQTEVFAFDQNITIKFHRSKDNLGLIMGARQVRFRFFLREKLNWAATYLFDVGLDKNWAELVEQAMWNIEREQILSQIDFRPIAINDLKFAFIFLSVGNTLGIICFFMEHIISKKYYRKINFGNFTGLLAFKSRKKRNHIRRIVVMPKQSNPKLRTTKKFESGQNEMVLLRNLNK